MTQHWRWGRSALLLGTALQAGVVGVWSFPARSQPAPNARPTGGAVSAGSASISYSAPAATTTVDQSSQRAAINWRSFNVGAQQSVNFVQPSASAMALNRVRSPNPSQIAGKIDANGQVVLINQSGVIFYKGAQVNTAGLIVSAAGMSNANFMAGKMVFDRAARPNAAIVNQGTLTVKQAGLAALVAPRVVNSGVIDARLGHVVLAGAKTATLDLYGDGLVSLDVSNEVTKAPLGPDGKPVTALVTNTGLIRADGGTVQLTAREASGLVHNLVEAGGTITAPSVGARTGTIVLDGVGGSVVLTGEALAQGNAPGTVGGSVKIDSSADVTLASGSRVSVSGRAGGGTVAIGTTLARAKGGPGTTSRLTAQNVTVAPGATIAANATMQGNGGRVTVLASQATVVDGTISATGGLLGGNGGFVETSGVQALDIGPTASVTAAAPHGAAGQWLLDPDSDILISNTGTGAATVCTAGVCEPTGDSSILAPSVINTALDGGTSVMVTTTNPSGTTQAGNITVGQGSTDGEIQLTTAHTVSLTLDAGAGGGAGSITINSPITDVGSGGALSVVLTAPNGGITLNNNMTVGGNITMSAGTGIALGDSVLGSANAPLGILDLSSLSGGVTQSAQGAIFAKTLQSSGGVLGNVSLTGSGNSIAALGSFTVGNSDNAGQNFALTDKSALTVSGPLNATGNIYLQSGAAGGITVEGSITAGFGEGNLGLRTDAFSITQSGSIDVLMFELAPNTPGDSVTLGATGSGLSLLSLAEINAPYLRIGAVTEPGNTSPTTTAGSINIAGDFGDESANNDFVNGVVLYTELDATGNVTEATSASLTTLVLTGSAASFSLPSPTNAIAQIGTSAISQIGIVGVPFTATGGDITIVDNTTSLATLFGSCCGTDPDTLALTGPQSARSIFYEDMEPGGTISLGLVPAPPPAAETDALVLGPTGSGGDPPAPMVSQLTAASGGRLSLIADNLTEVSGSTASAPTGTIEIAPFTPGTNITLGGTGGLSLPQATLASMTTGTLRIGGATISGLSTITAGSIVISGAAGIDLNPTGTAAIATTLELDATVVNIGTTTVMSTGGIDGTAGPLLNVGTLIANGTSINLTNSGNTTTNLGNVNATTSFALDDSVNLNVVGTVSGGTSATINDSTSAVTVSGNVNATSVALNGSSINLAAGGAIIDSGTVTLTGGAGGITEASGGTLIADTLLGNSVGPVTLISPNNTIAALGSFTVTNFANGLALTDSSGLTVNGPVNAGGNIYIQSASPNGITVAGTIANEFDFVTGLQTDALAMVAGGTINAGTFELAPNTPGNAITLGAAGPGLSLLSVAEIDAFDLRIGAVTEPGNPLPTTTAGSINIASNFGTSTVNIELDATGNVTEVTSASLATNDLTGTAASFSLPSPTNAIAEIDTITATSGDIAIVDNTRTLVLAGSQSAHNIFYENVDPGGTIALGPLFFGEGQPPPATLTATGGRISLIADDIIPRVTGNTINAPGGRVELAPASEIPTSLVGTIGPTGTLVIDSQLLSIITPTGTLVVGGFTNAPAGATTPAPSASSVSIDGPINLTGTAATLDLLAVGTVTQPGGPVTVNTLIGDACSATLSSIGNDIGTLGAFTATTGGFTLADNGNTGRLLVTGPVTAATNVALSTGTTGGISPSGAITAGTTLAIVSGNDGIGLVSAGSLTGGTVDLSSTDGVSEVAGAMITAGTLQSSGGISGGAATLAGTSNAIAALGDFAVSGNTFSLSDTGPLSVDGAVSANGVTIGGSAGSTPSGITMLSAGSIAAPTIALSAGSSGIALDSGAVLGETGASIDLASAGGISENAGATITAATLASPGSVTGGAVTLAGTGNAIADLGGFTVAGNGFSLSDQGSLAISGPLSASSVTIGGNAGNTPSGISVTGAGSIAAPDVMLTAGNGGISIGDGTSLGQAGATVGVNTTGPVTEVSGGDVIAGTLSVTGSTVSLPSTSNAVSTLGDSTATSFNLHDSTDLLIAATLNAAQIALLAPNNQISLGDGATIITGGETPPIPGPINPAEEPSNGAPGAFIEAARFSQIGSSTLAGQGAGPATLEISVSRSASFDPPLGLFAPNGWLILNLGDGTATGDVFVNALNVTHTIPGGATLDGTIDGVAGRGAAILGANQPTVDPAYTFNGCEIGAGCPSPTVTFTMATGPLYPALPDPLPPFAELTPLVLLAYPLWPAGGEALTDPDVVPPNVSYVDY